MEMQRGKSCLLCCPVCFDSLREISANFCWVLRLTHIVPDLLAT